MPAEPSPYSRRNLFLALPLLLLAALPALADAPARLDDRVSPTHDFATLPAHRARDLTGKVARYRVSLISDPYPEGKWDLYECAGDGVRLYSLWLPERQEVKDEMVVEAVLVVIYHKDRVAPTGQRFLGCVEYRLTRARRCR
jgi:hypothetical protein